MLKNVILFLSIVFLFACQQSLQCHLPAVVAVSAARLVTVPAVGYVYIAADRVYSSPAVCCVPLPLCMAYTVPVAA